MRLNARNKLLVAIAAILFLSFFGVSYLNYTINRSSVHAEIVRNDLPLTMDNIYSELTAKMTKPLLISSSMANDTFLKAWIRDGEKDQRKIIQYLAELKTKYGFFTSFLVSAQSNFYYRYSGIHKTITRKDDHDVWFYDFLESQREYDFDVDTDEAADNILTIFINYRVMGNSGQTIGVTGVGVKVDTIAQLISNYLAKYSRTVFLTDKNGKIQVHSDTSLLDEEFEKIVYNYTRNGQTFALLLLDLDNFKNVNDTDGHMAGDIFLVDVVLLLKRCIRPTDILARWGGDEFVILCGSDLKKAIAIADRMRKSIVDFDFKNKKTQTSRSANLVTLSCGVTEYVVGDDLDSMLYRADEAMYKCKSKGGNCIEVL